MANVLIVVYLLIVLTLIAVILLQRSEGGGLGMGGNSSGLMTVRGSANLLTRTTAILATLFFATAIGLTILSELDRGTQGILEQAADGIGEDTGPINVLDALNQLQSGSDASLPVPETTAPDPALPVPAPAVDPLPVPTAGDAAAPAAEPTASPVVEAPAAPAATPATEPVTPAPAN